MAGGPACTAVTSQGLGRGRIRRNLSHMRRWVVDYGLARRATFAAVLAGRTTVTVACDAHPYRLRRQVPRRADRRHLSDMPDRTLSLSRSRSGMPGTKNCCARPLRGPGSHRRDSSDHPILRSRPQQLWSYRSGTDRRPGVRSPGPSPSLSVTLTIDGLTPAMSDQPRGERLVGVAGRHACDLVPWPRRAAPCLT